jgi:regulator of sigma E protease
VGIGSLAIQAGRKGFMHFVYLMALISVSLAVINFLPFPVLDGGHAAFLIIEKIRGKPVPAKIMNITQLIGLAALLFVFVALTWTDIVRILKGLWM